MLARDMPKTTSPDYHQLAEGEELQRLGVNLESFYTTWKDVETLTLRAGEHLETCFSLFRAVVRNSLPRVNLTGSLLRSHARLGPCDLHWHPHPPSGPG